jgi:Flp pilus assembly protein TadG
MWRNLTKFLWRYAFRFRAAREGATVVEFALIAPVFIGLLIAIFETTLFLFAQSSLQSAATQAARLFMTGQAQNGGMSQAQIQTAICPMIQSMLDCSKLVINVQSSSSSSGISTSTPQLYNSQGQLSTGSYDPGNPGDLMAVYIGYPWFVVSGPLGFMLSNQTNGTAAVWGIAVFRVEPYSS